MQRIYDKTIEKPCGFLFARWSAGAKAFELGRPAAQRIITDPYAHYYSGQVGMAMVHKMHTLNPSIRKAIVLRARYMDDYSKQCMEDGYSPVVLLGAGYDSRYLRIKEFQSLRVFELDLASTQKIKKTLTRKLLGRLPGNVTYIPIDFSKDSITDKLIGAGYSLKKRTLFIWEGVTLFLNREIIAETLGRLAGSKARNLLAFIRQILGEREHRAYTISIRIDMAQYEELFVFTDDCADIFEFVPERFFSHRVPLHPQIHFPHEPSVSVSLS